MNTIKFLAKIIIFIFIIPDALSQDDYSDSKENMEQFYTGGEPYHVEHFKKKRKRRKPKNVILFIGDGMGAAHVFAGLTANRGQLYLDNFPYTGYSRTHSSDKYITDSAAGATAIATGIKTYNGAIAVDPDGRPLKTILEESEEKGLSTGLVSTSSITHATPASFIAHQPSRSMYEEIAADFLKTDIEVVIGGGYEHFTKRKDGRNLVEELREKDYRVFRSIEELESESTEKIYALTATNHNGRVADRGEFLPMATNKAIEILENDRDGFFLMIEGSQIDWAAHGNNTTYVVEEMLDLDKAIGKALEFAAGDGKTLVVVTADHETGGFAVLDGDVESGRVKGGFASGGHTATMVPVFAYGPGAEHFSGVYDNTMIYDKIRSLIIRKRKE